MPKHSIVVPVVDIVVPDTTHVVVPDTTALHTVMRLVETAYDGLDGAFPNVAEAMQALTKAKELLVAVSDA